MTLKIRLRKQGRKNSAAFRIVVIDARNPRDGKYVESLGYYSPIQTKEELQLSLDAERTLFWLERGAEISENVHNLVKRAAPEVAKKVRERLLARNAKKTAKERERRRAKKATAA